jgi:hypothetical protein
MMMFPVLFVCLGLVAQTAATATTAAKAVTFTDTKHDFGTVSQGVLMTHSFSVKNDGNEPVRIEAVDLRAPGMKTSFKPVIAPGETVRIALEWNSSRLNGPVDAKAIVRFAEAAHPPVELELKATVTRSIDVLPMPAVFFSVYKGETATRSVTVVNHESGPLEITGIEPVGSHFAAAITAETPGKTFRLDVTVPPTAEPGRFMEMVYLNTNHPTMKRLEVAVNVLVKHELYVNPETLELGEIRVAELAANPQLVRRLDQKLIVRKKAGDFAIISVTTDVPALNVRTAAGGRAQAFQIDVSVVPEKLVAGKLSGTIRIETDDKAFPLLQVPVTGVVR